MWSKLLNKSCQIGIWGGAAGLAICLAQALWALDKNQGDALVVSVVCMAVSFALMVVSFINHADI